MKHLLKLLLLFALTASLVSCDDEKSELSHDIGDDQRLDAPEDTQDSSDGVDRSDTTDSSDAPLDLPEDSPDISPDTPRDAADGEDGSDDPRWGACPDESAYFGDSDWTASFRVTGEATWCSAFDEGRTLETERDFLAKLQFVEGSYPFPTASGTWPFVLPACGEFLEPSLGLSLNGEGSLSMVTINDRYRATYIQPMTNSTDAPWVLQLDFGPNLVEETVLDGQFDFEMITFESIRLCWESCEDNRDKVHHFLPCYFDSVPPQFHDVVFEGGEITLEMRIGQSVASTEPGAFVGAQGSLDGVSFNQGDYWKLIYNPEHHHFSRDFVVLFDAPISGACGLKVEHAKPWPDLPPVRVSTVDCDLKELEERALISDNFRREE